MRRSKLFGANSAERKNHERKCLISFDNDCEFDPIANGPHSIEKMTRKYCTLLDAVRYKRVFTLTAVIVAYTHTHTLMMRLDGAVVVVGLFIRIFSYIVLSCPSHSSR